MFDHQQPLYVVEYMNWPRSHGSLKLLCEAVELMLVMTLKAVSSMCPCRHVAILPARNTELLLKLLHKLHQVTN